MSNFIDTSKINRFHRLWTEQWHHEIKRAEVNPYMMPVEENHEWNFRLWHEEDIARSEYIPLERIREAKRNIDRFNQARNDAIEKIDDCILSALEMQNFTGQPAPLHSETPGMMIDRLSIMALKEYHMQEQADSTSAEEDVRIKCSNRVRVLKEQQQDLSDALSRLIEEIFHGRRRFKVYRQFKMYNDPALNPYLQKSN